MVFLIASCPSISADGKIMCRGRLKLGSFDTFNIGFLHFLFWVPISVQTNFRWTWYLLGTISVEYWFDDAFKKIDDFCCFCRLFGWYLHFTITQLQNETEIPSLKLTVNRTLKMAGWNTSFSFWDGLTGSVWCHFVRFFEVVEADADFFPGVLDTPCKRTKVAQLGRSSPRSERCSWLVMVEDAAGWW